LERGDLAPESPSSAREPQTVEEALSALDSDLKTLDSAFRADPLTNTADCNRLCRALGSMRRSVDGVCRLAGDGDSRCRDARETFTERQQRVAGAGCGC
jgi:hypothetical protein